MEIITKEMTFLKDVIIKKNFYLLLLPNLLLGAGQGTPYYISIPGLILSVFIITLIKINFYKKIFILKKIYQFKLFLASNTISTVIILLLGISYLVNSNTNDMLFLILLPLIFTIIEVTSYKYIFKRPINFTFKLTINIFLINLFCLLIFICSLSFLIISWTLVTYQ